MEARQTVPGNQLVPLVRVRGLSKRHLQRDWLSRDKFIVQALDNVNLTMHAGCTLALVGESGSGKSTLARCLALLEKPSSGEIWFEGKLLSNLPARELFSMRRQIQLVFQDSAVALNPRLRAADIIAEPWVIQGEGTKLKRRRQALELMDRVGLLPQWGERLPLELSGGQRQRLAIARALAVQPKLLILDEALSALDPSVQAQIVNLLQDLQTSFALTYLYISHDLALVGHLAHEVAVMQCGKIVELANRVELFTHPQHSHTRKLLLSMPTWEAGPCGPT
jgi:ABC-type glutathione transport system ATPase component